MYITVSLLPKHTRNVKCEKPLPIFGNNIRNYLGYVSFTERSLEVYRKYENEKVIGYYRGPRPELMVRDPDVIRRILTADFGHFHPRGLGRNPDAEPLLNNLFHVDGDRWRLLRQRLTPAFTTGKLKAMFPLIIECAEKLQRIATDSAAKNTDCDVREMMARFTTDFIGACGFGIHMDSLEDGNSQFRALGRKIFTPTLRSVAILALKDLFPGVGIYLPPVNRIQEDILDIFTSIKNQRNGNPSGRNDFVDLLLELQAKGKIVGPSIEHTKQDGTPEQAELEMDMNVMTAQLFVFFAAGFETSSSATSYTLHQLAFNQDVQEKVYEDIRSVLARYDNKLCYDAINEMAYLDMAFKEGMRMFPSLGTLHRVCARKYTIPEVDVTIDPGVRILIPIMAIQNDEKYFKDPSKFIPERFSPENSKDRHKFVYLPFGDGPRACIGARLGQMQSLAGLAAVLHKFRVEPGTTTRRIPEISHSSNVVQSIKGGLPLRLVPRT
ncbi:Cytochrome P450 6B7 [Eumeta japonica]|uniref:unspecific monooxygenase n=1 Tax=Eumeta variegata TaxID=151549 RepID=A0A4C1U090_EUMVA|nr:Cytochrome P450 6B7 [Eumeta japonica]